MASSSSDKVALEDIGLADSKSHEVSLPDKPDDLPVLPELEIGLAAHENTTKVRREIKIERDRKRERERETKNKTKEPRATREAKREEVPEARKENR